MNFNLGYSTGLYSLPIICTKLNNLREGRTVYPRSYYQDVTSFVANQESLIDMTYLLTNQKSQIDIRNEQGLFLSQSNL